MATPASSDMTAADTIIATRRLVLRYPQASDLACLHARVLSDAQVMRHVFLGLPFTPAQSEAFFAASFDHDRTGRRLGVLTELASGEVVGFSGLMPCTVLGHQDFEVGFVLSRSVWSLGYGTEIGRGQLAYGFGALGCQRLLAQVAPDNRASIATLQKIGMQLHGSLHSEGRGLRAIYAAQAPNFQHSADTATPRPLTPLPSDLPSYR